MGDYARQLQDWLAATCRLLRRQFGTLSTEGTVTSGDRDAMKRDLDRLMTWLHDSRV